MIKFVPVALMFLLPNAVAAESKVDKAVATVKDLCLSGTQFDLRVDARGTLSLTKIKPGADVGASVNVRNSAGAAAIFDDQVRRVADEDIRSCIKPHISRIIDAILGKDEVKNGDAGAKKKAN